MSQDEGQGSGSKEDEVPSSSGSTCRICQKSFAHRSSLSRHKKVHESSQPKIACHKCGKIFKRKDFLKMHNNRVKSCDKPKPSSWECCSHTFKSFSSYRRHARTHHSDISNKNHDNNNNCTNNNSKSNNNTCTNKPTIAMAAKTTTKATTAIAATITTIGITTALTTTATTSSATTVRNNNNNNNSTNNNNCTNNNRDNYEHLIEAISPPFLISVMMRMVK